jgi:O-Antigen ligase
MLQRWIYSSIDFQQYLVWSTLASAMLLITVAHIGIDIWLAYPIVLINTSVLLIFDRLKIHRNHLLAITALLGFSLLGMQHSSTPIRAVLAQVAGISIMSIYQFSALTVLGLTVSRWIELYMRVAFGLAIIGLIRWPLNHIFHIGDPRLTSIFAEPSFYIYMTLPALGYCINRYLNARRYGWEAIIFIVSYVFADSAIGFVGVLLCLIFTFAPRIKLWQLPIATVALCAALAGLYFGSENFQMRARDTVESVSSQSLAGANLSTFALLSNFYVTSRTFLDHPITGVGIGGYRFAYDKYIGELTGIDLTEDMPIINRDDANSMFLRITAELGIPGLAALFVFLIVCGRVGRSSSHSEIRNALLPYLIVRMARLGAYFSPELYFFAGLYLLNYLDYRKVGLSQTSGMALATKPH